MSDFDQTKHPRNDSSGQFAEKTRADPGSAVLAGTGSDQAHTWSFAHDDEYHEYVRAERDADFTDEELRPITRLSDIPVPPPPVH